MEIAQIIALDQRIANLSEQLLAAQHEKRQALLDYAEAHRLVSAGTELHYDGWHVRVARALGMQLENGAVAVVYGLNSVEKDEPIESIREDNLLKILAA